MIHLRTVHQANQMVGNANCKHEGVTVITLDNSAVAKFRNTRVRTDLYMIKVTRKQLQFIRPGRAKLIPADFKISELTKILIFDPNLLRKSATIRQPTEFEFFSPKFDQGISPSKGEYKTIVTILNLIETEAQKESDTYTEDLIGSQIFLLLDYCRRYFKNSKPGECPHHKTIGKFNTLIKSYYDSKKPQKLGVLTVAHCAKSMNISANYLGDLLKRETGLNARQQIQEFVINKAKSELLQTDKKIGEISLMLGFNYQQHFSKFFKAQTGITPSSFRTNNTP